MFDVIMRDAAFAGAQMPTEPRSAKNNLLPTARALITPALLAATLSCCPIFTAQAQMQLKSERARATETGVDADTGVDASIKPGDDFFAYANGVWLKATEMPTGKQRWTAGNEITELSRKQVLKVLDDASAAPAESTARKVADFRAAYLNEAAIEAKGVAPIRPMLDRIDQVRDKAALTRYLGSSMRADADPLNVGVYSSSQLLGLAVEASIHGEKTHVAFLVQGGLGLPDREHYLSPEPRMQALRIKYQEYITRVLAIAGFDGKPTAGKRAEAVMALETAIAQSHATLEASSEDHNADNVWTRADFARKAPGMDWSAFFDAAGLQKNKTFAVWQPGAVKGAAELVSSQPLPVWKDYLRFHVIHARAEVLPKIFADQALAMRAAVAGQTEPPPRVERAIDATQSAMSEAVGRMYVERHFPAAQKARVAALVADVTASFGLRIDAVTWMSPATKVLAKAKVKALYFGAGYPEKWQDYSGLNVDPADAFGNLQRVVDRNYQQALARLSERIDHTDWFIAPQRPGAVLLFHQNSYLFAASLMQAPKFDPTASDAASYGAIGAIVGHDVTHFVDTLGAEYEIDGQMRRWWTIDDVSRFQTATQALVNQYSSYQPFPDLAVNGKLTLVENLADLGGLVAAFDAHRRALGSRIKDKDYVRQQDRQFFLGFARGWRSKMSEEGLRKYLTSDNHAPENYRVATVRNIDAWYDAFDVLPGQRLYLEPKARVRIW